MTQISKLKIKPALLVLNDGSVFEGEAIGAGSSEISEPVISKGEVVFHTGLSGYQEIITDPSYAGQIITSDSGWPRGRETIGRFIAALDTLMANEPAASAFADRVHWL